MQVILQRLPMDPPDDQQQLYRGLNNVHRNYNAITPSGPSDTFPSSAPVLSEHPPSMPVLSVPALTVPALSVTTVSVPTPPMDTMPIKGVPKGLEYLLQLNQLVVREKFSVSQGRDRVFEVLDPEGHRLFQAKQESQCCDPFYTLNITDNRNREVLEITQECDCCCTKQIQVYTFGGNLIGNVKLHLNYFVTHLSVMDPSNEVVLHIIGPSFQTNIFGNSTFEVKSRDEQHVVGMIKNESEQFLVSFPVDLDVTVKALLLGGCFFLENLIYVRRRRVTLQQNNRYSGYQAINTW